MNQSVELADALTYPIDTLSSATVIGSKVTLYPSHLQVYDETMSVKGIHF